MGLRPLGTRLIVWAAVPVAIFATTTGLAGGAASITMKSTLSRALGSTILVSATGRTLYHTSAEGKNIVKCTGPCAKEWLPLVITAGAKPVAGAGVTASKLGTVKRPDGKLQVTYNGLPLYLFAGDSKAGDVKGQGVGGIWHVVGPTGLVITKTVKTSSSSTDGSSTGSGSTTGSGSSTGPGGSTGTGGGTGGGGAGGNGCDMDPQGYGCM
jgi:predicted lipoprotein with Yx(FWY)xxD motif